MQDSFADVVLTGERVTLRPMREEDAEAVVRWRNDPEIHRWLFSQKLLTLESHREWFRRPKPDRLDFVVCLKETGQPIGTVAFSGLDAARGRAEAGKMIGEPSLWGKGLMKEAFTLWLAFGFERLGLRCIYIRTMASNFRSIGLNEKLGFTVEEVIRGGHQAGGVREDILIMGLTREAALRSGVIAGGNQP